MTYGIIKSYTASGGRDNLDAALSSDALPEAAVQYASDINWISRGDDATHG